MVKKLNEMGEKEQMKKFLRINAYLMLAFFLMASFALPQGKVSASSKKQQVLLHINGGALDKDAKVSLVYKENKKNKEKLLDFSRKNGTLYKAEVTSKFEAKNDITIKVKQAGGTKSYQPTKVNKGKGTINYWITVSKKEDHNKDKISSFTKNEALIPLVKDVYYNGDGTFTVYWGYENNNDVVVNAKASRLTATHIYQNGTPQIKDFEEGKVEEAFSTVFAGSSVVWELTGPDGVKRKAVAYASNAKAYKSLQPLLKGVYKNLDGTFSAYWGYMNENNVTVTSKQSQFQVPVLNNQQPMKTNFAPGLVNEAFKTTFNSPTIAWNLVGPNGVSNSVTADTLTAKTFVGLTPTVKAVYDNGNGTFTAYFGYQNQNDVTVDAIDSKFINGSVVSDSNAKMKNFLIGTNAEAFSVVFKGTQLTWELTGPDGQKRVVTATSTNAIKYTAIIPTVSKVINNGDGTLTAVWGYQNQNTVVVNARYSGFKGTVLKNEIVKKENFNVGVQTNAFETTFKGTELTWLVKGPDGVTRTVTAFAKDAVLD